MSPDNLRGLADCYRIIEETGSIEQALLLHPELERELGTNLVLLRRLAEDAPPEPEPIQQAAGRQLLLSALAAKQSDRSPRLPANLLLKLAGGLAGFILMSGAALGAAAAGACGRSGQRQAGYRRCHPGRVPHLQHGAGN